VSTPEQGTLRFVEGASEQGGTVGTVHIDLDEGMVDYGLFVITHELMHTLGATDKYDAAGHILAPMGLAEPERAPLYPQRYAEIMTRGRAIDAFTEAPPERLSELAVGPATAREIGWLR
jgi:hypothetical protein